MKKLSFVFLVLIMAACKKDEFPESNTGTPLFISEVNFNGTDYNLTAGENGLVLIPSVSTTDTTVGFISELSNPSCTNCGPALRLNIASPPSYNPNTVTNWIAELESWAYSLGAEPGEASTVLQLSASNGNNVSEGHWFLNGEQITSLETGTVNFELQEPGFYVLGYSDTDNACFEGESITIDYNGVDIPCYGSVSQGLSDLNLFIAEPGPAFDTDNIAYLWFVDGSISGGAGNTITTDANSISEIRVIIIDGSACIDTIDYIPQNATIACANNLRIASGELVSIPPPPLDFSLVTIEFRDAEGIVYSSQGNQENSNIEFLSIRPYEDPSSPNTLFAEVVFEVNGVLFNEAGQDFPFSGQIKTALELP